MTASKTVEQPVRGAKQAQLQEIEEATIRLCGDSGDGMQLAGTQFTNASAILGNDISTLPDFPAEIRAPAGTLAGVSGFQVHFSSQDIHTPGDKLNTLVAMDEILRRMPDIQVPDGAGPTWFHSTVTRDILNLPVVFTPGRKEQG